MALGGVVYIFSNHLSEMEEDENGAEDPGFSFKARFADFVNQMPLDNFKSQSLSITQKLLHRVRILLLKTDNHLMNLIGKIAKHNKMTNGNATSESGEQLQSGDNFWNDLSNGKQEEIPENNIIEEPPPHQMGRASPFEGGEVKVESAIQFNPVIKIKISRKKK